RTGEQAQPRRSNGYLEARSKLALFAPFFTSTCNRDTSSEAYFGGTTLLPLIDASTVTLCRPSGTRSTLYFPSSFRRDPTNCPPARWKMIPPAASGAPSNVTVPWTEANPLSAAGLRPGLSSATAVRAADTSKHLDGDIPPPFVFAPVTGQLR